MTKPIYSWIKYVVACAVMIGVAWGAQARRFIYYCGDYNYWPLPVESNEAMFENFKLYETEEGSNIYSGIISPGQNGQWHGDVHYFSFFTKLTTTEEQNDGLNAYHVNRVIPEHGYVKDENLEEKLSDRASAAYKYGFRTLPFFLDNTDVSDSWRIVMPDEYLPVKFTVDFNTMTVSAVFDVDVLVVNNVNKPTIDNINDMGFNGRQMYVPAGECRFRAYNMFKDKYYSLPEATEVKTTTVTLDSESDAFCTIPNWGGGTLEIMGSTVLISNRYQSLNNENPFKDWGETAYLVGSFTGWGFDDEYRMEYVDGIFYGKIPVDAGATQFIIKAQPDWESLNAGEISKTTGGNTIFITAGGGQQTAWNFSIDNVTEEMNVSFEPARQAVKIWPASQGAPDPEPEGVFPDGTTIPVIPKFTGIVLDQKDMFVDLTKVAPSEVGIGNLTAFNFPSGESKYEFTIEGALNKPFRFLEFKEDKLVGIIQPVNNLDLLWVRDTAHGSITTATDATPAYWRSKENGKTVVTIDTESNDLNAITFRMPSLIEPAKIYLVGSMNDWNTDEAYINYALTQTDDNKFYGAFDIPAGEVEFKFLKDLNGWNGIAPIAATEYNTPAFIDTSLSIPVTSEYYNLYNISFYNYEAGTIYMLVDDNRGELLLSKEPLDVKYFEGNVEEPDGIMLIDSANGDKRCELKKIAEGVYLGATFRDYDDPKINHKVKIVRRKHTFSEDEPSYLNSYTLTFADTQLAPGDDGVAETSFTFNDGINTDPGNEIEIRTSDFSASYGIYDYYVTVDFNTGKIYFDNASCTYLVGSNTGNKMPTYATRNDFANCRSENLCRSYLVELPQGDATIKEVSLFGNRVYASYIAEATFDSDGVAKTDNPIYYSLYPEEVILHNCPGGKIFVTLHPSNDSYHGYNFHMIAVDKIKTFDCMVQHYNSDAMEHEYTSFGQLTLTDPTTQTYSGRAKIKSMDQPYSWCELFINSDKDFSFGGSTDHLFFDQTTKAITYDINPERLKQDVVFGNVIDPTVDITLSLATMTGTVKLVEGDICTTFTVNTGYKDITLPPLDTTDKSNINASTPVMSDNDGIISLNFTASDGSIIVPANGDTPVTFDADGVFTGDIAVIKSPTAATRRAPLTAGKWYYSEVAGKSGDDLGIRFDLVNNKIRLVSDTHAVNLYAVAAAEKATVTEPEDVKGGTLKSNGDGTFSAKIHVGEGEKLYVVRRQFGSYVNEHGYGYGLAPQALYSRSIDFNSGEVDIPILPDETQQCYGWAIENNPGCNVMVHYNPDTMMLHLDMDLAGVEDVTVDDNCGDSEPIYYNLQGVRITNPESGRIYIELRGNKARKIVK